MWRQLCFLRLYEAAFFFFNNFSLPTVKKKKLRRSVVHLLSKAKMPSTKQAEKYGLRLEISIHAPRGGSDPPPAARSPPGIHFNPRSPWGERRTMCCRGRWGWRFQSTLPVGGATRTLRRCSDPRPFQSTLPVGQCHQLKDFAQRK